MSALKPAALLSTEQKNAGHYFTPDQLRRFNEAYWRNPATSYTIRLFSEADVSALEKRVAQLELALGGLLFDFDDGVNGGATERRRSLDYARTLCPAVEFKRKNARALEG